jgi:hypothetical protein
MKKLSFIFAMFLIGFNLSAQLSQLQLSSYNNAPFNVILDGQQLANNVSNVNITALSPGLHHLQLIATNPTDAFGNGHKPVRILFTGQLNVAANSIIEAVLYPNQLQIQSQVAYAPPASNNTNQAYDNYYYNHQGNGGYSNQNYGQNQGHHNGQNCQNNYNNNYPQAPSCGTNTQAPVYYAPQAMDPAQFQLLKSSIQSQWFSSGQMDIFNQALATNYFTSQQVKELVDLFSFDSDQLVVAKRAYTKTVDPQNYFVVNNALQFSSSVNALAVYIASL